MLLGERNRFICSAEAVWMEFALMRLPGFGDMKREDRGTTTPQQQVEARVGDMDLEDCDEPY